MTDEQHANAIRHAKEELNRVLYDAAESGLRVKLNENDVEFFSENNRFWFKRIAIVRIWRETQL